MKKKINPLAQIKKMGMTQHLFQEKKILIVLSVVVVIATALTVWNAIALQEAVKRNTQRYVNDVSLQLADDIDFRLKNNIQNLKAMADSLLRTEYEKDEPATLEYLARKAQEMGFNALAVIRRDGSVLSTDEIGNDLLSLSGVQASLQGEDGVSILDEQSLLYSVPFYQEDQIVAVLAGVRDKANMQALIEPKSFSGQGLTCIVHQDGKVVISPTVVDMFSQLDSIFMSQSNTEVTENILKMQEDMKQNRGGIFSFTAVDGSDLILSYGPLNSYHWVLLTLVPEDLISGEVDGFITQTFFIVAGVILVFWVLLVVLFRTDRRHYRQLEELSLVDHVTKGMNNLAFQIHCTQLLEGAAPNTSAIALLNIKNFKLINENFGSADGDRVLLHVMRVLEKSVDEDEVAARADADNFFLYLRESDPDAIRVRLGKITEMVNSYFCSGMEERHHLTIQQGVYVIDDPSLEITVMQDRAKTAYQNRTADEEGLCVFYDAAFTKRIQAENDLNDLFDTSLKNGDFHVFLQPKVWLSTEKVAGAEALVRWLHPQRGMIQPSDFIPLFEKMVRYAGSTCLCLSRFVSCSASG